MTCGYIYKTTNLTNSKVYIGQREGDFDPAYLGSGIVVRQIIKSIGRHNFFTEVLVKCKDKKELNANEIANISFYRTLLGKSNVYNISDGGDGGRVYDVNPMLGKSHSIQTRSLMKDAHLERWRSPTWDEVIRRKKISDIHKGKVVSIETRRLRSIQQTGVSPKDRGHKDGCLCCICKATRGELKGIASKRKGRSFPRSVKQKDIL